MGVWYATREDVKSALDLKETARSNARVDAAIEAASRGAEGFLKRIEFAPVTATRYFDWPNETTSRAWRLWLDDSELISVTTLTSGGTTIAGANFILEPNRSGPPYNRLELLRSTSSTFGGGSTEQRDITITGLFGHSNNTTTVGVTAEALDGTETGIDVDGPTAAAVGVGSLLQIDSERFLVTERSTLTTSQTLQTALTATTNNETVAVTTGSAYAVGEVILLDSERMLIVDITSNNLTVKRAWDGSTLAAHTGSTIFAYRALTVTRGALGTTAATHSSGASVLRWDVPGLLKQLVIAEAENDLLQQLGGYARTVGVGENEREASGRALRDIRERALEYFGRLGRSWAV
jgi:hypothetical protein